MSRLRCGIVIAAVLSSGAADAQVVPSLSTQDVKKLRGELVPPLAVPGAQHEPPNCDPLFLEEPHSSWPPGGNRLLVAQCAGDLIQTLEDISREIDGRRRNQHLIQVRVNYKVLKRWNDRVPVSEDDDANRQARVALSQLDLALEEALRARNLFAQFSASLMTGPSFTDTTKDDKGEEKTRILALGTVTWETRHFGDVSKAPWDFSIGGHLGVEPVLTVVAPSGSTGASEPALTTTQQGAFVWTVDGNAHLQHAGINAESGLFVRTGAAMLTSVPSAVDRGAGSFIALPVDNGVGKTAWLWEVGGQFTMFDNRLAQVHAEKGTTSPQLQLGIAWRHDRRFAASGPLATYRRPEQRLVFRLNIDALQVFDRRAFGQEAKTFTLGFSVEHERDFFASGPAVPSGTRYMLRGDLNLMKGFSSTDLPKPTDAGAPAKP